MTTEATKMQFVKRKTKQRLLFSLISLSLYFAFVLNWTEVGSGLGAGIGGSHITGSLVMFASLIVLFILLELLFIRLAYKHEDEQPPPR